MKNHRYGHVKCTFFTFFTKMVDIFEDFSQIHILLRLLGSAVPEKEREERVFFFFSWVPAAKMTVIELGIQLPEIMRTKWKFCRSPVKGGLKTA